MTEITPNITPDDCFSLEDITTFRALDGEKLADIIYYFWSSADQEQPRFLLFIEVLFVSEEALILTSGEDTDGIKIVTATDVINKAKVLMARNGGKPAIQQMNATASAIWQPNAGKALAAIRLTKNESGIYLNDALMLDFGDTGVIVALHDRGGLAVTLA